MPVHKRPSPPPPTLNFPGSFLAHLLRLRFYLASYPKKKVDNSISVVLLQWRFDLTLLNCYP